MSQSLQALHPSTTEYIDVNGSQVPWTFSTYDEEYNALRTFAGLFDHSPLGLLKVTGDVIPFLQRVLARDVEFMTPDNSLMSLILDDAGNPVDLVTIYMLDEYALVETGCGAVEATRQHLLAHAGTDVEIELLTGEWSVIGIEGPYSWGVVGEVIDRAITALPYEAVTAVQWQGEEIIFARSGFTGEYGYKVVGPLGVLGKLWEALSAHAQPVGYGVLETAMLEVRQPVLRIECERGRGVITAGMNWLIDTTKEEFVGREAVLEHFADPSTQRTIGLVSNGPIAEGAAVLAGDERIGEIAVAVRSPATDSWLALATVPPELASAGLELVASDGSSTTELRTLAAPYIVPASWTTPML